MGKFKDRGKKYITNLYSEGHTEVVNSVESIRGKSSEDEHRASYNSRRPSLFKPSTFQPKSKSVLD